MYIKISQRTVLRMLFKAKNVIFLGNLRFDVKYGFGARPSIGEGIYAASIEQVYCMIFFINRKISQIAPCGACVLVDKLSSLFV